MSNSETEICREMFDLRRWISEFTIDDAKRASLCFRETLIVSMKNEFTTDTKSVGGYCISVEPIGPRGHEFLVHMQSSMVIDGHFGGSKVVSSATEKFHCLEEKRTEFLYRDDGLHEKSLFVGMEDDLYHVTLTRVCPCDQSTESKDIPLCCNSKLISEGANVLIMRYLATIDYHGTLALEGITIDGDVAACHYKCTAAVDMNVDERHLKVYTVERRMYSDRKIIQDVKTYLTPQGRILRHDWLDATYVLRINPLVDPTALNNTTIRTPLRECWEKDIEMLSKYLDKKSRKMVQNAEYLAHHPEVKQLIADYTQSLLVGKQLENGIHILPYLLRQLLIGLYIDLVSLVKPLDVLHFTIQHFKAFAKHPQLLETSSLRKISDIDVNPQLPNAKDTSMCSLCEYCTSQKSTEMIETNHSELSEELEVNYCPSTIKMNSVCSSVSNSSKDHVCIMQEMSENDAVPSSCHAPTFNKRIDN